MKIRYQNGTVVDAIALSRTEQVLRVAVKDADDAMELTNIRGTWVTDDCEPVALELGVAGKQATNYTDDSFLCSQEAAEYLVRMLAVEGTLVGNQDVWQAWHDEAAPLIA